MVASNDGGDYGGTGEVPTHPKSLGRRPLLLKERSVDEDRFEVEELSSSNWHPPKLEGLGVDEEDLRGGEVDMEDDAFVEEDPVEEQVQVHAPVPWRLLARYLGPISPSAETLKNHFKKVWRLRTGVKFASIKPKWFTVTLESEGDFDFVLGGGPWVHLGNALLVKALNGAARPSETDLSTLPMWVKMYDVPWDKQTDANGRKWGAKLGKVIEVEADPLMTKFRDFLRVRIEIPINKRLQTKITTGVKDRPETHSTYLLRLRCSPMGKFQYREAYEPAPAYGSSTKRGLDFSCSDENSGNLGKPTSRIKHRQPQIRPVVIPDAVDAYDGFESKEPQGDVTVDTDLSVLLHALQVQFPKDTLTELRERLYAVREQHHPVDPVGIPALVDGVRKSRADAIYVQPLAMRGNLSMLGRGRSDMVPPLCGLSSWVPSESSTDSAMPEVTSVLGKRFASHELDEAKSLETNRAIVIHTASEHMACQKRGKLEPAIQDGVVNVPMEGVEFLEAISPGAADQLTGMQAAPRQEQ
ncbi:hypothetical protein ACQ4PT_049282 [Festuca glaucescens]